MLFKNRFFRLAALALTVAAPATASAGGRVGVWGGGVFFPSTVQSERDGERLEGTNGGLFAVDGGWTATDSLEIGGLVQAGGSFYDGSTFSATAGPRYSFFEKESRWRPFVVGQLGYYHVGLESYYSGDAFGVGASRTAASESDDATHPGFDFDYGIIGADENEGGVGLNVGGGLEFYPLDWLSVGADVRYHHAFVFEGVDYITTMIGASFHFG